MVSRSSSSSSSSGISLVKGIATLSLASIWILLLILLTRDTVACLTFETFADGDGSATNILDSSTSSSLPQNAGLVAEVVAAIDLSSSEHSNDNDSILRAEIVRRRYDGMIVVRPVDWYVYYSRGENFYYLTSAFDTGRGERRVCSSDECSAMILEPVSRSPNSDTHKNNRFPRTTCLNVTRLELLSIFARSSVEEWPRRIVSLDDMLEEEEEESSRKTPRVTVVEVLNRLMDLRIL